MTELNLEAIKTRCKAVALGPWYPSYQEFIAHAGEDIPALVAEVERLQTALEDCKESKVYPKW